MGPQRTLIMPTTRAPRRALLVLLALLVPITASACAENGLSDAYRSREALARAVLRAIADNDRDALHALRVTRDEHLELLWDELPESRDTPFEFAWNLNQANSRKGLRNALARYGGTEFELAAIEFTEPPEVYDTFTLHFGTRLVVRRVRDGREGELPILDVILERNGRWKLMNFKD